MHETLEDRPSLYIGLTGGPGSGKTSFAKFLDSLSPSELDPDFSDYIDIQTVPMRGLLRWHAERNQAETPLEFEAMQTYHEQVRLGGRGHEVWDRIQQIPNRIIIVDALREPSDMRYFKQYLGGRVVALVASFDIRHERFLFDTNDVKHNETEPNSPEREAAWKLSNHEMADEHEAVPGASYIKACVAEADTLLVADDVKEVVFPDGIVAVRALLRAKLGLPSHLTEDITELNLAHAHATTHPADTVETELLPRLPAQAFVEHTDPSALKLIGGTIA